MKVKGRTIKSQIDNLHKRTLFSVDSALRSKGFYGYFSFKANSNDSRRLLCIGFCPPSWLMMKSISLELELTNLTISNEWILSKKLRIQNRVYGDSPLMLACREGNVEQIRDHLIHGRGSIFDRTLQTGKTPLMVSMFT
jgi:Ankyrin repeat